MMNRFRFSVRNTTTLGLAMLSTSILGTMPANAAPIEIASDTTPNVIAQAPSRSFTATASVPNGIVVRGHDGHVVSLTTKGAEALNRRAKPGDPVVFTGLTAGRTYGVWIDGEDPIPVIPLARVNDASHLVVRTSETPNAVDLAWVHKRTGATGGKAIAYRITATSASAPTIRATVTGTSTAHLVGLQGNVRYRFTVTPTNSASSGKATTALMTRTLDEITGTKADLAVDETSTTEQPAPLATEPEPAQSQGTSMTPLPNTGGSSPARPATRTIYVCPDGYADTGTTCETTLAYTFHPETQTLAYTFHTVRSGGWNACVEYNPDGSYKGQYQCYTPETTSQVKDATPAGYTDNGSAWVATSDKIAQIVPA